MIGAMISLIVAASDSSFGDTLIGVLILVVGVAYGIYSYRQKICQFCGYAKNQHKDSSPCARSVVATGSRAAQAPATISCSRSLRHAGAGRGLVVRTARPRSAAARGARRRARFFFTAGLGFAETGYGSAQGTRSAHFIAAATSGTVVLRWPPSPTTASTTLGRRRDGELVR